MKHVIDGVGGDCHDRVCVSSSDRIKKEATKTLMTVLVINAFKLPALGSPYRRIFSPPPPSRCRSSRCIGVCLNSVLDTALLLIFSFKPATTTTMPPKTDPVSYEIISRRW